MRLDRNICLGGRLNGKEILGIKYGSYVLYPVEETYDDYVVVYASNGDTDRYIFRPGYDSDKCTTYKTMDSDGYTIIKFKLKDKNNPPEYICFNSHPTVKKIMKMVGNYTTENCATGGSFAACTLLEYIDISEVDFSDTTNFSAMFVSDHALKTIVGLETVNTSKVTNMKDMFGVCESLEALDLSNFDTGRVTNMKNMFYSCYELKTLDVSSFVTSKVTDMCMMFYDCKNLTSLNLNNFNTNQVTDMGGMFYGCSEITYLNLSNFDMTNVTRTDSMFSKCTSLHTLRLDNCNNATISKIITPVTFPTGDIYDSEGNKIPRRIYVREDEASGLAAPDGWEFVYITVKNAYTVSISNIEKPATTNYFKECFYSPEQETNWGDGTIDSNNSHSYSQPGTYTISSTGFVSGGQNDNYVVSVDKIRTDIIDGSNLFAGYFFITSNNLTLPNTSLMTDMSYMFQTCENLTILNLSSFDTRNVTNMKYMFAYCTNLKTLNLSSFNTNKVTNMEGMFNCSGITELNISNFNISPTTNVSYMFSLCYDLHTLRLDKCDNDTISKIIYSQGFPTNKISGITRKIYCKEDNAIGLILPQNWIFEFID